MTWALIHSLRRWAWRIKLLDNSEEANNAPAPVSGCTFNRPVWVRASVPAHIIPLRDATRDASYPYGARALDSPNMNCKSSEGSNNSS